MSELLPGAQESPDDDVDDPRLRALWGLAIIGGVAALVVLIMVLSSGTSRGGHRKHDVADRGPISVSESSASVSSPSTPSSSSSATSSASSSTSQRPIPTSTSNPCLSAAPCAVANDDGGAVSALNRFRVSHGVAPVPGRVTSQAQQCALSEGNGPACAPHYAWQPVSTQNGPQVISMIAGRGDGVHWLLDPAMKSFSIGWAYAPAAGGNAGQYECAVLKVT